MKIRKLFTVLAVSILSSASAWAAPAFVQATGNCSFGGTSNNTVTVGGSAATACPTAIGWVSNVTAGNRIVVIGYRRYTSGPATAISDGGDSCNFKNPPTAIVGLTLGWVPFVGYCYNIAGGAKPTITITFSNNEDSWYVAALEVSGTEITDALDGLVFKALVFTGNGTNAVTTGSWPTRADGDYIACATLDDDSNGRTMTAGTTSQAWTLEFGTENTHTEGFAVEDGVQTTHSLSTACAFTGSGGTVPILIGVAFRAAGVPKIQSNVVAPNTAILPNTVVH